MLITQSYLGVTRGNARCLFFLLHQDYIEAESGLPKRMRQEIERLARNMGQFGVVVETFTGDIERTRQHIMDKPWNHDEREKLRHTPALLMIDQDFDQFDPRKHKYIILHLAGEQGDAAIFRSLLHKLIEALPDNNSDPFNIMSEALREKTVAEAADMIELQPGIFGISLDLKHGWKSLKRYLRERKVSRSGS